MKNINEDNIKIIFSEGINYLQFQIELLKEENANLKSYSYMQYVKKNAPVMVNDIFSKILKDNIISEKSQN